MNVTHSNTATPVHLSYCTNVHAGKTWSEAFDALQEHVPAVRDACTARAADDAFGLGLRLSFAHLESLEDHAHFERFHAWLKAENLYVFTINGFPYGAFHGETVKADVYRPDWTEPERLDYTRRLVSLAAKLDNPEHKITISTLPGTYKEWADGASEAIASHWLDCVVHCLKVQQDTGVEVSIAIEPEPCCLLETADELVEFFARWIQSDAACRQVARRAAVSQQEAADAIARYLGVCHDVCHSAVEFEPALEAVQKYKLANIPVLKIQLSSALRLSPADVGARAALAEFDEPVYLHQVVRRNGQGDLQRYTDIHEAMSKDHDLTAEWRVHFHVPVFLDAMNAFGTTQGVLADLLAAQANQPITTHLEVETYTWDVLPDAYRNVAMADAIARELDWVQLQLRVASSLSAA